MQLRKGQTLNTIETDTDARRHITIFLPSLRGGGAERVMVILANGLAARGHKVDLVLAKAEGPYLTDVLEAVRIIDLAAPRVLRGLLPLMRYLRQERPDVMLSALNYANIVAILARKLARVRMRLVVSERSSLKRTPIGLAGRGTRLLMRFLYPLADGVICISKGIERDMQRLIGVSANKTVTIYNPVEIERILAMKNAPLDHPWFAISAEPLILAAGRLTAVKDYPTLIRAFAHLRAKRHARLVILGQGEDEVALKALASELGIAADTKFIGFHSNPFAWMARCDLYVMSSASEGFGNVLAEAMVCGAKIVSTDCPSGPTEILEDGRWGRLVPVGDSTQLASAMAEALDDPYPPNVKERAEAFQSGKIIELYEKHLTWE